MIVPHVTYREALGLASLETLLDQRQSQTVKMFLDITNLMLIANTVADLGDLLIFGK